MVLRTERRQGRPRYTVGRYTVDWRRPWLQSADLEDPISDLGTAKTT